MILIKLIKKTPRMRCQFKSYYYLSKVSTSAVFITEKDTRVHSLLNFNILY